MNSFISIAVLSIAFFEAVSGGATYTGTTTHYWDCCKPSCSWTSNCQGLAIGTNAKACKIDGTTTAGVNEVSGCTSGGTSYMCASNQPWNDTTGAYGFVAGNIAGLSLQQACCTCWAITFTSGTCAGQKMTVQMTNTGSDLNSNQFDVQIPGGGVGIFNACTNQYNLNSTALGAQYGGISTRSQCAGWPTALQPGCYWRFDWFKNCDNPNMSLTQVACPSVLSAKTGCAKNP